MFPETTGIEYDMADHRQLRIEITVETRSIAVVQRALCCSRVECICVTFQNEKGSKNISRFQETASAIGETASAGHTDVITSLKSFAY